MPKRVAEVGEGNEDGNGVYGFVKDLIVEGKDARFVNKKGRYVINWSRALDCYTEYKAKKNPQFKSKKLCRRKVSNSLRAALLNFYKKEGAKEYKESKKVNEKDEVIERQFQMPPRVLDSLFPEEVQLTDDSEQDEQETSSVASEGDIEAQVTPNSSSSDTGFDEFMDTSFYDFSSDVAPANFAVPGGISTDPCLDAIKSERGTFSPDVTIPSQMLDTSLLDSALEEICSSDGISDELSDDMDLLGVVGDICPSSGSVKGGFQFYVSLTEELPGDVTSGTAQFEGVADVPVHKLNPFTLTGIVPPSHEPGDVPVSVMTQAGKRLGMTCFRYVDEMREVMRQLAKDPARFQALWFAIWSQERGSFGADSNVAQVLNPLNIENQGQTKQEQLLKVLQLLTYTAAETDAQQFIEMIFSTSLGQFVFNSYKDRTPLPEDIARANGHEDLAQYLEDVNNRLTKEISNNVQPSEIDWLEFMKAVQKQALVAQDKSSKQLKRASDSDDNASDYFADAETSSCGSFEVDADWSDSEDKKSINKESWTKEGVSNQGPTQRLPTSEEGLPSKIPVEKEEQVDNKEKVSGWGFNFSLPDWLSKWPKRKDASPMQQGSQMAEEGKTESPSGLSGKGVGDGERSVPGTSETRRARPKIYGKRNRVRSSRRTEPAFLYKGIVLTCALLTVLAGIKLGEGRILHWAVGNGYTRISKLLLHCGLYVDAPGYLKETPLHVASKSGFIDLVDVLIQSGGNVNARNHRGQETPLHLAAQNGHQHIAEFLIQHGSQVNAKTVPWQDTSLHLAAQSGHTQVVDVLLQRGSDVNARNFPRQEIPLHLAARNGHQHIAEFLLQHGSQVNAKTVPWQETPLHLAARNGHKQLADVLLQHGSAVNVKTFPWQKTPLHLATENGHAQTAEALIEHGSDVNSRDDLEQTPLHQAALHGHKRLAEVLVGNGSDVNCGLLTPLHLAAESGHRDISEFLLQCGSDVNAKSVPRQDPVLLCLCPSFSQCDCRLRLHHLHPQESTPLHLAAENGHKHVAEDLIRHGGNINAMDKSGQSPLHLAAQHGRKQTVEVLLQHGSDVNARNRRQETPLHLAAENGCTETAEVLIQHGSDVNSRDVLGQTPLHQAALNGHKLLAEVLVGNGSDVNCGLLTPLHLAAQSGHRDISEFLLQRGSDVNAKSVPRQDPVLLCLCPSFSHCHCRQRAYHLVPQQSTPLHLAAKNGYNHVAKDLIRHGGNINARDKSGQSLLDPAAQHGHKQTVEVLLQRESVVNAANFPTFLYLAAEKGRRRIASKENGFARSKFEQVGQKQTHFEQISEYLRDGFQDDKISQTVFYEATDNKRRHFPQADSSADYNGLQKASARVQTTSRPHVRQANLLYAIIWIDISNKTSLAFSKRKRFSPHCQAFSHFVREPMGERDHSCQSREEIHCKDDWNHSKFLAMCDNVDSCMVDPSAGKGNTELVRVAAVITPMKCCKDDVNRDNVLVVCNSSSDPRVVDSSEIKAGEVLSFCGPVCGYTGYYTEDSLLHSYNNYISQCRTVVITALVTFFVIIAIVLGWMWFQRRKTIFYPSQQDFVSSKTCEPHVKDLHVKELLMEEVCKGDQHLKDLQIAAKELEAQKCFTTFLINEHREKVPDIVGLPVEELCMKEVRMERLKSWLMQDLDVEEEKHSLEVADPSVKLKARILGMATKRRTSWLMQDLDVEEQSSLEEEKLTLEDEDSGSDPGYCGTPSPKHKKKRPKSISAPEVVTDRLGAESAVINDLQFNKPIVTSRGDIAYHFRGKNTDHDLPLEEGDVIGFLGEPHGKSHIERRTLFNALEAEDMRSSLPKPSSPVTVSLEGIVIIWVLN